MDGVSGRVGGGHSAKCIIGLDMDVGRGKPNSTILDGGAIFDGGKGFAGKAVELNGAVGVVVDGDPLAQDGQAVVQLVVDRDPDAGCLGVGNTFLGQNLLVDRAVGGKSHDP